MICEPNRSPRSFRKFLRFGVRGLIVLVLVVGAGLGWIVRQAHIQRDAVAAIKEAGGSVRYDWEFDNRRFLPGGKPWAPTAAPSLESLARVASVSIHGESVRQADRAPYDRRE